MKLKKIGLIALSISSLFAMAACSGNSDPTTTTATTTSSGTANYNFEGYPEIKEVGKVGEYTEIYSSFSINTDNVKKVFYLGDAFESTGLVVYKNYLSFDSNNKRVDIPAKQYETKEYTLDSSNVDMNTPGKYPVSVTCRVGTLVSNSQTYEIEVRSSLFETTPNISYISGIDVSFTDDTKIKEFTQYDDINIQPSDVKYSVHKKTVDAQGNITDSVIPASDLDVSKISIDTTKIKNDVVGTYLVTVTYDNGEISINGKNYPNKVVSYALVDVSNPITKIEYVEGENEFEASVQGVSLDDWVIRVTRKVDEPEEVNFSTDLFIVDDLDEFTWKTPQDIKISSVENPTIFFKKRIVVTASTTQDIKKYDNLTKGDADPSDENFVKIGGTDFIFVDKTATFTARDTGKDTYGKVSFLQRISMGAGKNIKVVMDKPGQIVVFFASSTDGDERTLSFKDSEKVELDTATATANRKVCKAIFNVDAAGTYYFSGDGGTWLHGFVIAKNLDE